MQTAGGQYHWVRRHMRFEACVRAHVLPYDLLSAGFRIRTRQVPESTLIQCRLALCSRLASGHGLSLIRGSSDAGRNDSPNGLELHDQRLASRFHGHGSHSIRHHLQHFSLPQSAAHGGGSHGAPLVSYPNLCYEHHLSAD